MGFGEAIKTCLRKYADFSGRASRSEFWWFQVFAFMPVFVIDLLKLLGWSAQVTAAIFCLLLISPWTAVSTRRLHDMGKPLSYMLLIFALLLAIIVSNILLTLQLDTIGASIVTIVAVASVCVSSIVFWIWLFAKSSDPAPNKYGPNPHEVLT